MAALGATNVTPGVCRAAVPAPAAAPIAVPMVTLVPGVLRDAGALPLAARPLCITTTTAP